MKDFNKDLTDPRLMYLKAGLFFLGGLIAVAIILLEHPNLKLAAMLAVAIWCFCRFYYFAFYVIEHYIDGKYKFAGLWSFVRFVLRHRE
jgi:hypothetical protein